MAYQIVALCVNCTACEPLCPSHAIAYAPPHFWIDSRKCSECDGAYAEPQCGAICPIEGAILNAHGEAVNPPGSLTGIPPSEQAASRAQIQAR